MIDLIRLSRGQDIGISGAPKHVAIGLEKYVSLPSKCEGSRPNTRPHTRVLVPNDVDVAGAVVAVRGFCELVRLERVDESPSRNRRHAGLPAHAAGALTVRIRRRFAGVSLRLRSSRSATMPLTLGRSTK